MEEGSTSYARLADRYERIRGGDHRARELADEVLPWLPEGRVLDIGAGTGIVSQRFADAGREVIACDLSIEMVSQAAPRLHGCVAVADAASMPIRDAAFDAVTYVWVLHHVGDLASALAEAQRVVRPGGRVISVSGLSMPPPDDMAPVFERLNQQLRPHRVRQADSIPGEGVAAGLEMVHEGFATTTTSVSPTTLAAAIEDKQFSHLWDLTDDVWAEHVTPAIAELRGLPDPDEPRKRTFRHPFVVFER